MTHADWMNLLIAVVAAAVIPVGTFLGLLITGLGKRLSTWLEKRGLAAEAAIATAGATALAAEVNTSASVIAGKIDRGELDPTDRKAWEKLAIAEVPLIQSRLPALAGAAIPTGAKVLTDLMAAVDNKTVASPTINAPVLDKAA